MNPNEFKNNLDKRGIILNDYQLNQYKIYYNYLIEINKSMDLTNIVDEDEVYLKHFFDSLTLAWAYPDLQIKALKIVDVGSGAGFPSLPLKIAFPQLKIVIVDSLKKRINFLNQLIKKLNLTGVCLIHQRAEIFGNKNSTARATFDVATARALKSMPMLVEMTLPLVKRGGVLLAMKGLKATEEIKLAKTAIPKVGGAVESEINVDLPNGDVRRIIIVKKVNDTLDKYPRKFSDIKNKTL